MSDPTNWPQVSQRLSAPYPKDQVSYRPVPGRPGKHPFVKRSAIETRLNEVLGLEWESYYKIQTWGDRVVVTCELTLCGVTRSETAEARIPKDEEAFNPETGERKRKGDPADPSDVAASLAFKRAAGLFGIPYFGPGVVGPPATSTRARSDSSGHNGASAAPAKSPSKITGSLEADLVALADSWQASDEAIAWGEKLAHKDGTLVFGPGEASELYQEVRTALLPKGFPQGYTRAQVKDFRRAMFVGFAQNCVQRAAN